MSLFIILGGFGSSLGNTDGFALAFSFRGERGLGGNGGNAILGTINSDGTVVQIPDRRAPWAIFICGNNDKSSYIDWSGAADYEDATPHRIVYNIQYTICLRCVDLGDFRRSHKRERFGCREKT